MDNPYDHYWKTRGVSGHRPRYRIFLDWVKPKSRILEFGAGDGYLGDLMQKERQAEYLATDISEAGLATARSRGVPTEVLNASDVASLRKRFPDHSYDYVIMTEFLEHIVNSEDVLKEAIRIARVGVLVSIPNSAYWRYRLQLLFGNFPKQWAIFPYEHVRFWSVTDFLETVRSLGFQVNQYRASNGKKPLRDWWPNLFGFQICYYIAR